MADILESVSQSEEVCKNCTYTKCKTRYLGSYFTPLKVSFEKLLKTIADSYHLNADTIFETEEEYIENNQALKAFSDLWDYETPEEDKALIFKQNADLM